MFQNFQKQKKEEADAPQTGGVRRSDLVWKTPEKGTVDKPKVYEGRFIPDKKGNFYKKYSYHMFLCGEKWAFSICPKTYGFDNYCPFCSSTSKLYQGTAADKKMAYNYKRKDKFVSNFYITSDPRDAENEEKVEKTVKLYEFPAKVEMKLKDEITDTKNGYGYCIFDPGEEGHNFILKVLATKKDVNGNVWPDYSSSTFSRTSDALGSDNEIKKIMSLTTDLNEYVKGLEVGEDKIKEWLKAEMLYDFVAEEMVRVNGAKEVADKVSDAVDDVDDSQWDDKKEKEEEVLDDSNDNDGDVSDEELMKELEEM